MKINYNGNSYPLKRMIINCTDHDYNYVSKAKDLKVAFLTVLTKVFKGLDKGAVYNRRLFIWKPFNGFDGIVHVFNSVYIGKSNWVCTIEHMYPACYNGMRKTEYKKYCQKLKKYLLKDNCKALLPLSDYSKNVIEKNLQEFYDKDEFEIIKKKIKVLHPPQMILATKEEVQEKYKEMQKIKICFVGRDFWRKGGYITYKCLKELSKRFDNFEFILISSLNIDDAAYCYDVETIEKELETSKFVTWYRELPNSEVLKIIKESHLGMLPTYGDTYGFSVLEMQSSGCPVITCNNYALKEINTDDAGWLLDINKIISDIGDDYTDINVAKQTEEYLICELERIFNELLLNVDKARNILEVKAIESLKLIIDYHDPITYKEELNRIYTSQ